MLISQKNESRVGPRPAHILHLEDKELDRALVKEIVQNAGIDCEITAVDTRDDFITRLDDEDWDVILSDYSLPAFDGFEALAIAAKTRPTTPFIFVTGTLGEEAVVESLKHGATDYILKQRMTRLAGSVGRALNERAERRRREEAEAERDRSEERLRYLAYHDALTDLPNRALFQDRLAQTISDAIRRDEKVALLFIDLDRFKDVNDSLGHSAGDIVLKQVAERLRDCVRGNDTVARLGGDEFVVVASAIRDSTDAVLAANRIKTQFATEFMVNGVSLFTTCSIGISVFPVDGTDAEALLKNADIALFSAKDGGRNGWRFFTEEMNGQSIARLRLETALRRAIEMEQFFLEYQPQLEFSTGKIVGAEALLRWRHPEMGLIPPNTFIPIAENIGEIIPIGEWVLRAACAQAKKWQEEGLDPLVVAVNVSAVQLRQGSLHAIIKRVLDETGLAPQYLELEITESLLLTRGDEVAAQMLSLREMGLRLALDDFGTGYSSFSYMRRFRFDKLKIDGSFVRALNVDPKDTEITASIIGVGKILKMEVIAECVETKEQVEFLRSFGCDHIQGYYFSRPLSAAAFMDKARSHQASGASLIHSLPQRGLVETEGLDFSLSLSEALMESLPVALCIFNVFGQVRRWNANMFGYTADELLHSGLMSIIAPESLKTVQQAMREALIEGKADSDAWIIAKSGAKVPCFLTGVRIIFENEPCILGIAMDITNRMKAEDELRRSKEDYDILFEGVADAIFANRIEDDFTPGKFIRVNKAACECLGYTREELYNLSPLDINVPEHMTDILAALAKVPRGEYVLFETEHIAKDGRRIPVEITGRMVESLDGPLALSIVRDISERKRAEEMLKNSEKKYRALFDDAVDAYLLMDDKGFLDCNSAALRMFGYSSKAELVALRPVEFSPQKQPDGTDSKAGSEQHIAAAFLNGSERFEWVHKRKDGGLFTSEVCMSVFTPSSGPMLLGLVRDLSERKSALRP